MSDILDRLKNKNDEWQRHCDGWITRIRETSPEVATPELEASMRATIGLDAANEIESLRAELAKARNAALEEAAKWHDAQVQSYTDQIAENDAYMARTGRTSAESRANEYCDDQRSTHRRSAAAIRALREEE